MYFFFDKKGSKISFVNFPKYKNSVLKGILTLQFNNYFLIMKIAQVLFLLLVFFTASALNKSPFNLTYSKILANYSAISYCPYKAVNKWDCPACKTTPQLKNVAFIVDSDQILRKWASGSESDGGLPP